MSILPDHRLTWLGPKQGREEGTGAGESTGPAAAAAMKSDREARTWGCSAPPARLNYCKSTAPDDVRRKSSTSC